MQLGLPDDLGHVFETDVRTIGFRVPMPVFEYDPENRKPYQFARTLAEAVRLSAARMLETDARGIAATVQIEGDRPLIVLYDTVAGGAGYVRRLAEPGRYGASALVRGAVRILDCHAACASSCAKCLNDYGNQQHWDNFDRKLVLPWLSRLADDRVSAATFASPSAIPWENRSLASLRAKLTTATTLDIAVSAVAGAAEREVSDETVRFLRDFTEAGPGRQVRVFLRERPDSFAGGIPSVQLPALEELARLERSCRVAFFLGGSAMFRAGPVPRLSAHVADGHFASFSDVTPAPLLDGLLVGRSYLAATLPTQEAADLTHLLDRQEQLGRLLSQVLAETKLFDYAPGAARSLEEAFGVLKGAVKPAIAIVDPYLLSGDRNRRLAAAFLAD